MIEHNLCQLYGGLTPIGLDNQSFKEVIELYADVRRMQIREKAKENKPIRRRAADDAGWW